jgi:hypothetical protein
LSEGNLLLSVAEVFNVGGLPTITYNPRAEQHLEQRLQEYLGQRYQILSVSGRSKTGKSVLVKSTLHDSEALWVPGGAVHNLDDYWAIIGDQLRVNNELESTVGSHEAVSRSWLGELKLGFFGGARKASESSGFDRADVARRRRSIAAAVRSVISPIHVVVIDDFHYIDEPVQVQILRSMKDLIFEGVPLIICSTPHRVEDAARIEREMVGRVQTLRVPPWFLDELTEIAATGFEALHLIDESRLIAERLAQESHQNPILMQQLCREVCRFNGIEGSPSIPLAMLSGTKLPEPTVLNAPDWPAFFTDQLPAGCGDIYRRLTRRPLDGTWQGVKEPQLPLPGRILGELGASPQGALSLEELLSSPNFDTQITFRRLSDVLKQMHEAAVAVGGDPVIDYDERSGRLHLVDPFFAFFLRWSR